MYSPESSLVNMETGSAPAGDSSDGVTPGEADAVAAPASETPAAGGGDAIMWLKGVCAECWPVGMMAVTLGEGMPTREP